MKDVTLRPITLSDTELIVRWRNSDAVRLNMYDQRILTAEQHRDYYRQYIVHGTIVQYIIDINTQSIGTVFYKKNNDGLIELGLFIGEEEYRGKGYGRSALTKILSEVKSDVCFKHIRVKVRDSNIAALRLYESLGFVRIGTMARDYIVMEII